MSLPKAEGGRARRRRIGDYAPLPLVAVAILLIVLILFTPLLLPSGGQPAPGVLTQAELIVDRISGNQTTHFYIHALGTTARYTEIWVGLASGFDYSTLGTSWARLNWSTWTNESDVLSVIVSSIENPVGLNVTAYYTSPGGTAWYVGVVALYVVTGSTGPTLYFATPTPGLGLPGPTPVDNTSLPLTILLPLTPSGGPP